MLYDFVCEFVVDYGERCGEFLEYFVVVVVEYYVFVVLEGVVVVDVVVYCCVEWCVGVVE